MKLIKKASDFDGMLIGTPFLLKYKDTGMVWVMQFKASHILNKVYIESTQSHKLPMGFRPYLINGNEPARTDDYWYFSVEELKVLFNKGYLSLVFL